jgi:hypothetical protein
VNAKQKNGVKGTRAVTPALTSTSFASPAKRHKERSKQKDLQQEHMLKKNCVGLMCCVAHACVCARLHRKNKNDDGEKSEMHRQCIARALRGKEGGCCFVFGWSALK